MKVLEVKKSVLFAIHYILTSHPQTGILIRRFLFTLISFRLEFVRNL